jgi:integrase
MARKTTDRLARGDGVGYERNKTLYKFGEHNAWLYQREGSRKGTWYLRFYVAKENLNIRQSLKTAILSEAKALAHKKLVGITSDVDAGRKIGSQTVRDAIRAYQRVLDERVARTQIKARTRYIHNLNIDRVEKYLASTLRFGLQTKVGDIDGSEDFKDYWEFRKKSNEKIGGYSVNLELSSFHLVLAHAKEKGFCGERALGFVDHSYQREAGREKIQNDGDYEVMLTGMRKFRSKMSEQKRLSKSGEINEYYYFLMRHVFLIAAQCGARTGEILNLRNKDIKKIDEKNNEVYVHYADTKTDLRGKLKRKGRDGFVGASLEGVNYLIRWISNHRRFNGDDDYVFSTHKFGGSSAKDAYYLYYKTLCEYLKKEGGDYERVASYFDTYHCRHFYITRAIELGNSLEIIATACGNSAATIARDYNHLLASKAGKLIHAGRYERISKLEEDVGAASDKGASTEEAIAAVSSESDYKLDESVGKDGIIDVSFIEKKIMGDSSSLASSGERDFTK